VLDEIDIVPQRENGQGGGDVPHEVGALGKRFRERIGEVNGAEGEGAEQEEQGKQDVLELVPTGPEKDKEERENEGGADHEISHVGGDVAGGADLDQQENDPDGTCIKTNDGGEGKVPFS